MSNIKAIVVGAGTSGSIVARRLVDAGIAVVVLEAGGEDLNPAIHDPMRLAEIWHSADDWDYYTVPQEHAAGRRLHLPRGKVLGGSHALNAMIWVRCAPADFDHWAALGNDGWAWDDVLPVYKAIEDYSGGASDPSRRSGSAGRSGGGRLSRRNGVRWRSIPAPRCPTMSSRTTCGPNGFTLTVGEVVDGGDTVVGLGTYSGTYRATGRSFAARVAHIWHLADGRVTSFEQVTDTELVNRAVLNRD